DQLVDVLHSDQLGPVPPEREGLGVVPSGGVQIVQWALVGFGHAEQAARDMQQPGELARPALGDPQPIVDGNVGRGAVGQAEFTRLRDNRQVARMDWLLARPPNAGELPDDYGLGLCLLSHTGSSSWWWSRSMRGVVPLPMPAGQGPPQAACPGLDRPAHNQTARAQHV